ncbi:helix-turn-helix transcriptional regulator [Luteipulveratus sp. YIM 133132]|uniref:helix-turn-helix transcriptional regulator n=1 Tax=Luteipulveratus flavus TaxID=3031728 RepID=UPI0023B19F4E|nr:helix-turn-helix transcriptional regulator [Luteipulveratus sp. YIM 133132]MDE9367208.1 helix-turn-helix transcriptional regulator [Luteipulveratus sp. YIM 133132]
MTADPFEALVTRLSEDLDRLTDSAADLAADAHFSRFHYERIVSAVAGESPTAFRRRILLERAAYRMIHSDATLIDVALEAGFGSHAAFTRAFRRSYDATPSSWRLRPTRFQLPSPNDVHFHPPAGLRLPARTEMTSMDVVDQMVRHHVWLVDQLVARAGRLTDEQLDAPLEAPVDGIDGDSLRQLLSRLIGQMEMWLAAMHDREYDFAVERHESVASMRTRNGRVGPAFVTSVEQVARERRFDETFVDARPGVRIGA